MAPRALWESFSGFGASYGGLWEGFFEEFSRSAGGEAGGDEKVGCGWQRGEIVLREPENGLQEVSRDGNGGDEARNGFGGEIDVLYTTKNDASDGFAAQRNEDELAGEEILVGRVGERAAAKPKDL